MTFTISQGEMPCALAIYEPGDRTSHPAHMDEEQGQQAQQLLFLQARAVAVGTSRKQPDLLRLLGHL